MSRISLPLKIDARTVAMTTAAAFFPAGEQLDDAQFFHLFRRMERLMLLGAEACRDEWIAPVASASVVKLGVVS